MKNNVSIIRYEKRKKNSLLMLGIILAVLAVAGMAMVGAASATGYEITFNDGGGSGTMSKVILDDGVTTYTLPANGFTAPANSHFACWSVKIGTASAFESSPGAVVPDINANVTVTAVWHNHSSGWTPIPAEGLTIEDSGTHNYYLPNNTTLSKQIIIGKKDGSVSPVVNICLNGNVLTGITGKPTIQVYNGATLKLYDCGSTKHYFSVDGATSSTPVAGLWKYKGETLVENSWPVTGGCITGGAAPNYQGGCVKVEGGGTFMIYGGNIVGNSSGNETSTNPGGGGIYVTRSSGPTGKDGVVNMYGGSVLGNIVNGASDVKGGGVGVFGIFKLYGGNISYNSSDMGGGIFSNCNKDYTPESVSIYGGSITNNSAKDGGGIYIWRYTAATMSGGTIKDNVASQRGGGVYDNGFFTMTGGSITDNNANGYESGLYSYCGGGIIYGHNYQLSDTGLSIGGTAVIKNNKKGGSEDNNLEVAYYVESGEKKQSTATIKTLKDGADIGVSLCTGKYPESGGSTTFATGAASGDAKYFHSDNSGYHVENSGSNLNIVPGSEGVTVKFTNGEHGTLTAKVDGSSITSGTKVAKGKNVVFTITPVTGYVVDAFTVNTVEKKSSIVDGTYTESNVQADLTVNATFKDAVASVTSGSTTTYYETLDEAITASGSMAGTVTIKVLQNATVTGSKEIKSGVTLDVNTKTVSLGESATLTITGTISGSGTISNASGRTIVVNNADTSVNGANLKEVLDLVGGDESEGTIKVGKNATLSSALVHGIANKAKFIVDTDVTLELNKDISLSVGTGAAIINNGIIKVHDATNLGNMASGKTAGGTIEVVETVTAAGSLDFGASSSPKLKVDEGVTLTLYTTAMTHAPSSVENSGTIAVKDAGDLTALNGKIISGTLEIAVTMSAAGSLDFGASNTATLKVDTDVTLTLYTTAMVNAPSKIENSGIIAVNNESDLRTLSAKQNESPSATNISTIELGFDNTTLDGNLIIAEYVKLQVPSGKTLTIPAEKTFTITGTLDNDGTVVLDYEATLTQEIGTIDNDGTITVGKGSQLTALLPATPELDGGTVKITEASIESSQINLPGGVELIIPDSCTLKLSSTDYASTFTGDLSNDGAIVVNNESDLKTLAAKKNKDETKTSEIQVGPVSGGLVISDGTVTVDGKNKLVIPSSNKLIVKAGTTLTVNENASLNVLSGTLETEEKTDTKEDGTSTINGTITCDGTITNGGTIVLSNGTEEANGVNMAIVLEKVTAGTVKVGENAKVTAAATEVKSGVTLVVPNGKKLTVGDGTNAAKLTVNGALKTDSTETYDEKTVNVADANNGIVELAMNAILEAETTGTLTNNGIIRVNDEAGLRAVVEKIHADRFTGKNLGVVQLGSNVTVTTNSLSIGGSTQGFKTVILDLNGQVMKGDFAESGTENQSVIYLESGTASEMGAVLTLIDSNTTVKHYFTMFDGSKTKAAGLWKWVGPTETSEDGFEVTGGVITGGTKGSLYDRKQYGGAVFMSSYSAFTMNGGALAGNGGSELMYGGGVGYKSPQVTFTMNGGSILGNYATFGGGVYSYNNELTMTGGSIQYNHAVQDGGGMKINNTLHLGGDADKKIIIIDDNTVDSDRFTNNVYLWYTTIQIANGGFNKTESDIGVMSGKKPYMSAPVTIVDNGKDYDSNFKCDNDNYKIMVIGDTLALAVKDEPEPPAVTWTVTFKPGEELKDFTQTVPDGWPAVIPETPEKVGFVFVGWYTDVACENKYDFSTPVTENFTLYGNWKKGDFSLSTNLIDFGTETTGYTNAPATQSVTISSAVADPLTIDIPEMTEKYKVVYLVDGEVVETKPTTVEFGKTLEIQIQPNVKLPIGDYQYEIKITKGAEETEQSKTITIRFVVVDADSSSPEIIIPKAPTVRTIEDTSGATRQVIVDALSYEQKAEQTGEEGKDVKITLNAEEKGKVDLYITNAMVIGPDYERTVDLTVDKETDNSDIFAVYDKEVADYEDKNSDYYQVRYGMEKVTTSFMSLDGTYHTDVGNAVENAGYNPLLMISSVNTGESLKSIDENIKSTEVTYIVPVEKIQGKYREVTVLHVKENENGEKVITPLDTTVKYIENDYAEVTGYNPDGKFSTYVLTATDRPRGATVTSFSGTKNGNDFTFSNATVVTKATLPSATSARITNTSGSGWYNFKLDAPGMSGTGTVYFQVPTDVISVKEKSVNDVSLVGCTTTYLKTENGYAKYSAIIPSAGTYTIDFVSDSTEPAVIEPTVTDEQGYLKITSTPAGATIQIEGVNYRNVTPQEKIALNPGTYTVTLSLDGYNDISKSVTIKAGETTPVTLSLVKKVVEEKKTEQTTTKSPFPVLGILAGLGAAVVMLRRR